LSDENEFDVVVVGAGPAGLATGLCCAVSGLRTAVAGPVADVHDGRTAALLDGSINLLKRLGVWTAVEPLSEPLTSIRLVDATGSLVRAPEVLFDAREIGLPAFGYNVANAALTAALESACETRLARIVSKGVSNFEIGCDFVRLSLRDHGAIAARIVAAADGRRSSGRAAAGIAASTWSYPQSAVVTTFAHSRPHYGTSTEMHRQSGPLTVVPGPGNTSSLVWVESPDEATRIVTLPDDAFAKELETHLHGLLGRLSSFSPRRTFPLSGQTATVMGKDRIALVGEAAHTMPPIGAQGLNLSFRDAATLAEVAAEAKRAGQDVGGDQVLARYTRLRDSDVRSRVYAVDILNRTLLSSIPGVHLARGFGLFALATSRQLRMRVMREGVMPALASPALTLPQQRRDEIEGCALDVTRPLRA
jgi:2-octaprenyl-6-methoxyphenol hydroxylase